MNCYSPGWSGMMCKVLQIIWIIVSFAPDESTTFHWHNPVGDSGSIDEGLDEGATGTSASFGRVMINHYYIYIHSLKLTWPLKIGHPKLVFQPFIFRSYVSFREGSNIWQNVLVQSTVCFFSQLCCLICRPARSVLSKAPLLRWVKMVPMNGNVVLPSTARQ